MSSSAVTDTAESGPPKRELCQSVDTTQAILYPRRKQPWNIHVCRRMARLHLQIDNIGSAFLVDRTNGRAYARVLRLLSVVVCLYGMYCG